MAEHPVLIGGKWRSAKAAKTFQAVNPATGERLPDMYPVSGWEDCDAALSAAADAANELRRMPPDAIARFLTRFADRIEEGKAALVEQAHIETALPKSPRLADVELPRTVGQLRQAADAALEGSWALPTIDTKSQIRSCFEPLGPVVVFGPNNFPYAFSGVAGGDFAAAIAAGNPVIGKAHPLHPGTGRLLAEAAVAAINDSGLPPATVQMIYKIDHQSGQRLVSDIRVGASAFTGSRTAGMALKNAADAVGKPIYLEMSSINPVVILPGALAERGAKVAADFASSCLMGGGQFCTNAGFVMVFADARSDQFIDEVKSAFDAAQPPALLSEGVAKGLADSVKALRSAGADLLTAPGAGPNGARHPNTLLRVTGKQFLAEPEKLQTEAFGSASLCVVVRDVEEAEAVLSHLEGNLTGCIYSDTQGSDEAAVLASRTGAAPASGPIAERQDADGSGREPRHESRWPFPRDRPSRLYGCRDSGVAAPLRHAVLLRQRAPA